MHPLRRDYRPGDLGEPDVSECEVNWRLFSLKFLN
jgi:hypothetical protein